MPSFKNKLIFNLSNQAKKLFFFFFLPRNVSNYCQAVDDSRFLKSRLKEFDQNSVLP